MKYNFWVRMNVTMFKDKWFWISVFIAFGGLQFAKFMELSITLSYHLGYLMCLLYLALRRSHSQKLTTVYVTSLKEAKTLNEREQTVKYPKINSLWKREPRVEGDGISYHKIIPGDYACAEFGNIKKWVVQEKIDGTNIRIHYNGSHIIFYGRSDEATIPRRLENYLKETFTKEFFDTKFPKMTDKPLTDVWLFGEGYGAQIQKDGGNYQEEQRFILFDCVISKWWLEQSSVKNVAEALGLPYAPVIGIMEEAEIIEYVKNKPISLCSKTEQVMEGVICRPCPMMMFRDGGPLMFKLKVRDFA